MGEVYLAQDTSELGRNVAIKIISAEVANNKDRLQRFTPWNRRTLQANAAPSSLITLPLRPKGSLTRPVPVSSDGINEIRSKLRQVASPDNNSCISGIIGAVVR